MSFNDYLVYVFMFTILAAIIAIIYTINSNTKKIQGETVVVKETRGFNTVELKSFDAISYKKSTTIQLKIIPVDIYPLRLKLIGNGIKQLAVSRLDTECNITGTNYFDSKGNYIQNSNYTPHFDSQNSMLVEIEITGENCLGLPGQGYIYEINLPVEQYNGNFRNDGGSIRGHFK